MKQLEVTIILDKFPNGMKVSSEKKKFLHLFATAKTINSFNSCCITQIESFLLGLYLVIDVKIPF